MADCPCYRCTKELCEREPFAGVDPHAAFGDPRLMRMFLCETCGNKRCPHAADHRHACTGSNAPGQTGSLYENAATAEGSISTDGGEAVKAKLAYHEPLTPCFPSPPSQPGGEAERLDALERENAHLRVVAQKQGCPYGHAPNGYCELGYPGCACMDDMMAVMAYGPEDEGAVANKRLLARAEASEQKLAEAERMLSGVRAADLAAAAATIRTLEQRLSAALGEVERRNAGIRVIAQGLARMATNPKATVWDFQNALSLFASEITALLPSGTGEAEGEGR